MSADFTAQVQANEFPEHPHTKRNSTMTNSKSTKKEKLQLDPKRLNAAKRSLDNMLKYGG